MPAPSWEDLGEFLDTDEDGGFATRAVFSLASGATLSVTGIFEDTTLNTHTGEYEIDLANPRLECSFAEVTAVSHFDTVLIDGISYQVADLPQNDGSGWGIIRLAPLDPLDPQA